MRTKCHIFFETLATKLKINLIIALKDKPLGVNELSQKVREERSKVSHALRTLLDCGFIAVKKEGRQRIYSLNKTTIMPLLNLIERHVEKYCKICKKK